MATEIRNADSLRELSLKVGYRSDVDNLIDDFYVPCLRRSVRYQRAVGYFTSAGLAAAAKGLAAFVHNNGKMQLVASPWFDEAETDSIRRLWLERFTVDTTVTAPLNRYPLHTGLARLGIGRLTVRVL